VNFSPPEGKDVNEEKDIGNYKPRAIDLVFRKLFEESDTNGEYNQQENVTICPLPLIKMSNAI
jgi:hypothetical protein